MKYRIGCYVNRFDILNLLNVRITRNLRCRIQSRKFIKILFILCLELRFLFRREYHCPNLPINTSHRNDILTVYCFDFDRPLPGKSSSKTQAELLIVTPYHLFS